MKLKWFQPLLVILVAGFLLSGCSPSPPPNPTDTTPPWCSINWPNNYGQVVMLVGGLCTTVEVEGTDDIQLASYQLFLGSELIVNEQINGTVFNDQIDVSSIENLVNNIAGEYTLRLKTLDGAGNFGESSVQIRINPTELRQQAIQLLREHCCSTGNRVNRWATSNLVVQVSPEIIADADSDLAIMQSACAFWTKYTGITFTISAGDVAHVEPYTRPGVVYNQYGASPAIADTWTDTSSCVIRASIITYNKVQYPDAYDLNTTTHELGHALGVSGHLDDGSIMDVPNPKMRMTCVLATALKILYFELDPGDII